MSKLILLAWNNKESNQDWISEVETKLSDFFDETSIQRYSHRQQDKSNMDLEYESKVFINNIDKTGDYVIFAKSAWTILAMKNIFENWLNPKACIFVGVPMWMIFRNGMPYENWFKNINIPILFIQKTNDPTCNYKELVDLFYLFSDKFKFKEIPWNTHDYTDVDLLRKLVGEFIKNNN